MNYLFEKYIDGELTEKERVNFEYLLSTDLKRKQEYNLRLNINKSIIEEDVINLRKIIC
jgi:hypothetical protein